MLYKPIGTRGIEPRSYIDEIEGFEPPDFHIANRHDDISRLVRQIAYSKRPNFAIVGEPGNGKTITLDYMVDVITGNRTLPEDHQWYKLFEVIKTKVKQFQTRDYMFLPNLQDPYRPVVLDFEKGQIKEAEKVAETFNDEIINFLNKLGHHEEIHPFFGVEDFKRYVRHNVKKIYENLYSRVDAMTDQAVEFDLSPTKDFQRYGFDYRFLDKRTDWQTIRVKMGLQRSKVVKGENGKKKRISIKMPEVKKRFKARLRDSIHKNIYSLFSLVDEIKVPKYSVARKRTILRNIMEEVRGEYQDTSSVYESEGVASYYRELIRIKSVDTIDLKLSEQSLDWAVGEIRTLTSLQREQAPDSLKVWLDSVVRYFAENKDVFSKQILELYKKARGVHGKRQTKRPDHPYSEERSNLEFLELPHGKQIMDVEDIFRHHSFYLGKSGELFLKYPTSFSDDEMWGKIESPTSRQPPHMCFTPGYLMEASMLVLIDNMQGFFKALLGREVKEAAARRQTILNFIESGDLIAEKDGMTFKIHSPTMIIGCDNDDPFVKRHSYVNDYYEHDRSMASRFVLFNWENYAQNTPDSRRGTLQVMRQSIAEFNKTFNETLDICPEIMDLLLTDFSYASLVRLDYRKLEDQIFDILSFLRRKDNSNTFSLDDMVKYNREKEPKWRFTNVDERFASLVREPPREKIGAIYGVALTGGGTGDIFPIRSGVVMDLAENAGKSFQHIDSESDLNTEVTHKGYIEAVDFVKRLIGKPTRFISKTTFHRAYGADGDSASLAIALSLCSAITETPILRNRVFTGNVSFADGTVGPIGRVYTKSLMVWRAYQKMKEAGHDEEVIFTFPEENYRELAHALKTTPYPVEGDIRLIPVQNFDQAFHIATNREVNVGTLNKTAPGTGSAMLKKMRTNVTKLNKKVIKAYKG